MAATKTLYHFTSLFHLAPISREGISLGETPVDYEMSYDKTPKGVNLTTNGDPATNRKIWCEGSGMNKVAVRLTVELPEVDVVTFRQFRERFKVREKALRYLCPYEERKHWFYYFEPIPPNRIVRWEKLESGSYRELSADELSELVKKIDAERERAFVMGTVPSGRLKGAFFAEFKPGVTESFLCDGRTR